MAPPSFSLAFQTVPRISQLYRSPPLHIPKLGFSDVQGPGKQTLRAFHVRSKTLFSSLNFNDDNDENNNFNDGNFNDNDEFINVEDDEEMFLKRELARLEDMEEMLDELDDVDEVLWDEESLNELLEAMGTDIDDIMDDMENDDDENVKETAARGLELALLQGVVPVSADVGSECLPGDWGFDPLGLSRKDYFQTFQNKLLDLLPSGTDATVAGPQPTRRPRALILRDYREAEIRHGRLAMLAAIFWPLQEMLDRLLLDAGQFGPLVYGPVTLPYFPLFMTAIMLLLGYLDIYAGERKNMEQIGDAFLPGDCFWDPLNILEGTPNSVKRNMQERELFNGRVAMLAVVVYFWEEFITHKALIDIEGNDLLFLPAYQVPFIQRWLDAQFSDLDPESAFLTPLDIGSAQSLKEMLDDELTK